MSCLGLQLDDTDYSDNLLERASGLLSDRLSKYNAVNGTRVNDVYVDTIYYFFIWQRNHTN